MNIINITKQTIEIALYEECLDDTTKAAKERLDYFRNLDKDEFEKMMYDIDDMFIDRITELREDMIWEFCVKLIDKMKESKNVSEGKRT